MALKIIVFASFAITGSLFYLSKSGSATHQAKTENLADVERQPLEEFAKPTKKVRRDRATATLTENSSSSLDASYASLLPTRDEPGVQHSPRVTARADFNTEYVEPTINSCFKDLIRRKKEISTARDRDAEGSFNGLLKISVAFDQNAVASIQSRSIEIRDLKFHNCIEAGAKQWNFPQNLAAQSEWSYSKRLIYDVSYKYDCKGRGGVLVPVGPVIVPVPVGGSVPTCF